VSAKKPSAETLAIISAIESSNNAAKAIADAVAKELAAHTRLDDARHEENRQTLAVIATDVKSLLDSRSFTRGIWKAASTAGGLVGGVVMIIGLIIQWWRGH
jgi:hypothetical protein